MCYVFVVDTLDLECIVCSILGRGARLRRQGTAQTKPYPQRYQRTRGPRLSFPLTTALPPQGKEGNIYM